MTDPTLPLSTLDEDEWVARCVAAEAAERDRWAQAYLAADLTPRANGRWATRSTWQVNGDDTDDITISYDTYAEAVAAGRHTACCSGVRQIWVYGPDGRVHHTCDTSRNNFWLNHIDISAG